MSGNKSWEHAWTIDEIRKNTDHWMLAADVGLLKYMQDFSSRMTGRAHDVSKEVSQLMHDTSSTNAKIQTVSSFFMSLSDSQFIENRVYDEDDSAKNGTNETTAEEKQMSKENKEAEVMQKVKQSLKLGLDVIDHAFDVLEVKPDDSDMDSEDEDDDILPNEVLLEAKDPYVTRPLPHLIGSRNFQESEFAGVGDLLSSREESDGGSVSESEDEVDKANALSDVSSSFDDNEDYSSESALEDDDDGTGPAAATSTASDDDFSSSDEGSVSSKKSASDEAIVARKTRRLGKKEMDDMFADDDDEPADLFAPPSGGMFGTGQGLFDVSNTGSVDLFDGVDVSDSNDEEDVTTKDVQQATQKSPAKSETNKKKFLPHGGVSLFGGAIKKGFFKGRKVDDEDHDDDDDFVEDDAEDQVDAEKPNTIKSSELFRDSSDEDEKLFSSAPKASSAAAVGKDKKQFGGKSTLFDETDDEENDMHAQTPAARDKSNREVLPVVEKKPVKSTLFDDDDEPDLFGDDDQPTQKDVRERKPPASGVSMLPAAGLQEALIRKTASRRPVSSSESSQSEATAAATSGAIAKSSVKSSGRTPLNSSIGSRSSWKPSKSLFSDSSNDDDDDLFAAAKPQKQGKGAAGALFAGDEDDDIFSSSAKSRSPGKVTAKQPARAPSVSNNAMTSSTAAVTSRSAGGGARRRSGNSKTNLFALSSSDDDDDFFASATTKRKQNEFSSADDDDKKNVSPETPASRLPVKAASGGPKMVASSASQLFGGSGDDSDDDDLFAQPTSRKPPGSVSKKPSDAKQAKTASITSKKRGLFDDDDDDMFSSDHGELPAPTVTTQPDDEATPVVKKKLAGAVSMFGPPGGGSELSAAVNKLRSDLTSPPANHQISDDVDDASLNQRSSAASGNCAAKPFTVRTESGVEAVRDADPKRAGAAGDRNKVNKLQRNLLINPAALLPGAAPAIKHEPDDRPLESATKTRSKGQSGRRPPTRRGRRRNIETLGEDTQNDLDERPRPNTVTAAPANSDIVADDDLFSAPGGARTSNVGRRSKKDLFDDDDDDFLADLTTKKDVVAAKPARALLLDDEIDDLFGDSPSLQTSSSASKKLSGLLHDEDDDDIFGPTPPSSNKPSAGGANKLSIFDDGDDDFDDIFSTKIEPKNSAPSKKSKPRKTKPKKKATTDDDKKDDGIFDDPLSALLS